jgi:uncharacterized protein YkwD
MFIMGAFENIAKGPRTPASVVAEWMNSPEHRAAILDERLTHLGAGFYRCARSGDYFWTQKFIG